MTARPHVFDLPAAGPDATLPTQIGGYRVMARLGEGATSEVFLGRDDFRARDVALKRVRAPGVLDGSDDQRYQQKFFAAEAALVGRLRHPNVVQIYDAVEDPQAPYLVMEYVNGPTLRHFCRADRLLPLEQVVELGFKCAMALGYVFRQGLIHRDVKPANLLAVLERNQVVDVKISDFGSVLNLASDRTQVYRVGSLAYMSPEQLDGKQIDCRADIYSLAAVLYHLIAGRPPFEAETQGALMAEIYNAQPVPLSQLREDVPSGLDALVQCSLSKHPDDRPPDWDSFAQELSGIVARQELPRGQLQGVLDSERFTMLRSLEFFAGFGDVELWEVVHRARWRRYPAGHALYRKGQHGRNFHIVARGGVEVLRDGECVARLGVGQSVGEMAYLAPSPELRLHTVDVNVTEECTTISFTPEALQQVSPGTKHLFDHAFIGVLVRRLHAAHEALAHPRRIL